MSSEEAEGQEVEEKEERWKKKVKYRRSSGWKKAKERIGKLSCEKVERRKLIKEGQKE